VIILAAADCGSMPRRLALRSLAKGALGLTSWRHGPREKSCFTVYDGGALIHATFEADG
jgi:hypothetical protein